MKFESIQLTKILVSIFGGLSWCYLIWGLEDCFIDALAFFRKLKPKNLSENELQRLCRMSEKPIAIIIPAWREANVIRQMLLGNINRIKYKNYQMFVGCYPNDLETMNEIKSASKVSPRITPVVNRTNGPTSKGQMLNEILKHIRINQSSPKFAAYLMQDSEDLIDPWILKVINKSVDKYDFIQIPVFSLEVKAVQWVAGTYMDEFAESHTKDMLVRQSLGAAIPSAGVGTALSETLVAGLLATFGEVFCETSLTEDYEVGLRSHQLKFKSVFLCQCFTANGKKSKSFIATREYFPKKIKRSIRQKTRWNLGIAIQSWKNIGWTGSFWNRYFLYRDRRCLVSNIASGLGYVLALYFMGLFFLEKGNLISLSSVHSGWFILPILFNPILMAQRMFQRTLAVKRVYGAKALMFVPLRWPVATLINFCACGNAIIQEIKNRRLGGAHRWEKTEHELPTNFGIEPAEVA